MIEKILDKHIKMIGELKIPKTAKRILLIKSAVMAGLFSGEKISRVVRKVADKLNVSEATVWKVIKFDEMFKQIESDYMQFIEYLKMAEIKEMLGESNANTQQQS